MKNPVLCLALVAALAAPARSQDAHSKKVELGASFSVPSSGAGGPSYVPWVGFTADGARLCAVTSQNDVALFDSDSRRLLQKITLPNDATDGLSLDRTGRTAAWVLKDGTVGVTELETGKVVARLPKIGARWAAMAPDAKTLAVSIGGRVDLLELPKLGRKRSLVATHRAQRSGTLANISLP